MALNHDRVGHRYSSYAYEVSREKVREYATATGVGEPAYRADPVDVPSHELIAPPAFAACFTVGRLDVLLDDPELGAHPGLVHTQQSFTYHQPIRVGSTLRCTPQITDIAARSRMEALTVSTECVDDATGEPVVTGVSTLVFSSSPTRADA